MPETQTVEAWHGGTFTSRTPFSGILENLRRDPRTDPQVIAAPRPHVPNITSSEYLSDYLDGKEFQKRINLAKRALTGWLPEFDAIAFRGMSGALIAPPVARSLGKSLIMVRKASEDSHSEYGVEGDSAARAYIIVDDLTCSGDTQRAIRTAVKYFSPEAVCLGVLEVNYISNERLKRFDAKYPLVYVDPNYICEYRKEHE